MIILIVLIVLLVVSIYLLYADYGFDLLAIFGCVVFGIYLMIHIFCWSLASYDYNMFVAKRNAFEKTLQESRSSGREYESAAIVKEVSQWNTDLARHQYNNKLFLLKDYIDDRIDDLEAIK